MIARLFLLFTIVPAIELFLLLQLGSWMGPLPTFLLIVTTGVLGASFARREGMAVLQRLAADASRGLPPAEQVVEGALIVAGGLLLVTPGVLTDLTGLAMIMPWTRRRIAPVIWRWISANVVVVGPGMGPPGADPFVGPRTAGPAAPGTQPREAARPAPFDHPIAD